VLVKTNKAAIAISLLIVALGVAWLVNKLNITPGYDWFWTTALLVSGLLLLTIAGIDRFNFVVGVSLIVCAVLSALKQWGKITDDLVPPILFTTIGVLLFLAQVFRLPKNRDVTPASEPK
jgi:hypothetical protein